MLTLMFLFLPFWYGFFHLVKQETEISICGVRGTSERVRSSRGDWGARRLSKQWCRQTWVHLVSI